MKTPAKPNKKTGEVGGGLYPRDAEPEFRTIEPKILYFGTPVALVSSWNEDGSTDLAPISSFWALGWTMTLGLLTETKTAENLERHCECVVNLPSPKMWKQVEKLAPLTAKNPVPELKKKQFHYEPRKFEVAELTPLASELVKPTACEGMSRAHGGAGDGDAQVERREAWRIGRRRRGGT